jgi:hypothetical protein
VQTVSAKPSITIQLAAIARTPREAVTVTAPKARGIAAATGERKTSSRTSSRKGIATSSATSVERTDSSMVARERLAKPLSAALTGGVISSSSVRSR